MIAALGACALVLAAQTAPPASVSGTVRVADTGAPLAGALVVLGDIGRSAVTGADGRYLLADVPPGPAHLTVEHPGHVTRLLHILVPREGGLRIDVTVLVAPIELEELVVRRTRPVRGIEPDGGTSFPDRSISAAALHNHPVLAEPDVLRALAGGEVDMDPEAPIGVHVRGGASDHVAYTLDGIPVLNPVHAAGVFSAWNPDAVAATRLISTAPSPTLPDALAGVVAATTRTSGRRLRLAGAVSNTQARATLDGPIGTVGAGYLLSVRAGFPGPFAGVEEGSYLAGETADILATVDFPLFGGEVRVLHFDAENEITAAVDVPDESAPASDGARNAFDWQSRSTGASWSRQFTAATVRLAAWSARAATGAQWSAPDGAMHGGGRMGEEGLQLALGRSDAHATSEIGVRLRHLRSRWTVHDSGGAGDWAVVGSTTVGQAYVEHARQLTHALDARAAVSASATFSGVSLGPRIELRWRPAPRLAWLAAYARTHQFAQSARNAESVVGHIFPADIFLVADDGVVPVPRADQLVLAGEWTPLSGVRVAAQTYTRRARGLFLVAPGESAPVATAVAPIGASSSRGASLELSVSGARYGFLAGYGWNAVVHSVGDLEYRPRHGPRHVVEAGAVLYPSTTSSIRVSLAAAAGRRSTAVAGPFEWEACNLLDRGCEFAGSPAVHGPLGDDMLPRYLRVDGGVRKHWHVRVNGRPALVGLFGTVTNIFGRANILAHAIDPETGEREAVSMLPRAPLSIGVDWRF